MNNMTDIADYIARMPKAELHVHIEGTTDSNNVCVVDALYRESYSGEDKVQYGKRKGHITGHKNVAVYDGSLLEWTSDPELPMTDPSA